MNLLRAKLDEYEAEILTLSEERSRLVAQLEDSLQRINSTMQLAAALLYQEHEGEELLIRNESLEALVDTNFRTQPVLRDEEGGIVFGLQREELSDGEG